MKSHVSEELPENIEVVTPGVLLKEARISLQLTPNDIAKRLNLKSELIEAIDADDFDDIPSVTFARGYLKGYARLVHLDVNDVLSAFEYMNTAEKQSLEMQSFSHRSSLRAKDNWLSIFSYLVVSIIAVLAVVWYLQRNEQTALNVPSTTKAEAQLQSQPQTKPAEQPSIIEQVQDSTTDLVQDAEVGLQDQTNEPEVQTNEGLDQQIAEQTQSSEQAAAANLNHLELRFSDSCWINIEDATGNRIAIGTKSKGHLTSVYGVAPFSIKLGKPDAVSIWLDGKTKEIPYYPKGSIASFELSSN